MHVSAKADGGRFPPLTGGEVPASEHVFHETGRASCKPKRSRYTFPRTRMKASGANPSGTPVYTRSYRRTAINTAPHHVEVEALSGTDGPEPRPTCNHPARVREAHKDASYVAGIKGSVRCESRVVLEQ